MKTLLIVLDSLRYDAAMRHEGLCNLLDWDWVGPGASNAPYTPSSLTTIATGLYPATHRCWDFPPDDSPKPKSRHFFFDWGIPSAWYATNLDAPYVWPIEKAIPHIDDAVKFFETEDECILAVHIWETHIPYGQDKDIEEVLVEMKALDSVDNRLDYVNRGIDAALEKIKPILDAVTDDTVVILTSDHGEALGELDPFTDEPRWMHQHAFLEEMLVPMFLHGCEPHRDLVRLVDIAPTIAVNYDAIPGVLNFDGRDIYQDFYATGWSVCRWNFPGEESRMEQGFLAWDPRTRQAISATIKRSSNLIACRGDADFRDVMEGNPIYPKDAFSGYHEVFGDPFDIDFGGGFSSYSDQDAVDLREKLRRLGYIS